MDVAGCCATPETVTLKEMFVKRTSNGAVPFGSSVSGGKAKPLNCKTTTFNVLDEEETETVPVGRAMFTGTDTAILFQPVSLFPDTVPVFTVNLVGDPSCTGSILFSFSCTT